MQTIKKQYKLDSGQFAAQMLTDMPTINGLILDGVTQFLHPEARISSNMVSFLEDFKILQKKQPIVNA